MENKELEIWLSETKAKNLSKEDLKKVTNNLDSVFYNKLRKDLKVVGTLYEHLFNQWQKEAEFSPKRGDKVLVWDIDKENVFERIFLADIKGSSYPIIVVAENSENHFINNKTFASTFFMNMKPLPTEQPTETDFKSKVIELIESEINLLKSQIDSAAKDKLYQRASNLEHELCGMSKILNKIKHIK